ncbi:MAG TPA: transcriptional repressor [Oceanipulchritudo sp.]|nr:transcriptional repressor [Oceanipulchritudo sp.]
MIRRTRQRLAIEEVFQKESRPLTPPEIFDGAKRVLPQIGLRTVYRQIKDMAEEGLVVGVDYPGQPLRYEWVSQGHHAHFICRKCDRVYDLQVDVPDVIIKAPPGFQITGQETVFYGICPECA